MTRQVAAILALLIVLACKDDHLGGPPLSGCPGGCDPVSTGETSASSTTSTPDLCIAYTGCREMCTTSECRLQCRDAVADVDHEQCVADYCQAKIEACAADPSDPVCAELPGCNADVGESSTSGGTADSSSGESTSTTSESGGSSSDTSSSDSTSPSSDSSSSGGSSSGPD
jgi:hypothetical protein